jgi:hypothetical protein
LLSTIFSLCLGYPPESLRAQEPVPVRDWSFSVLAFGGRKFGPHGNGPSETKGVLLEAVRPVSRRLELGISLYPWMEIDQPRTVTGTGSEQVTAVALEGVLRWFPLSRSWRVEPYLEAVEGLSYADAPTPAGGTQFNFLAQAGVGFCFHASARWGVIAGYRWLHVSNAGLGDSNPSRNFHAIAVGLRVTSAGRTP